MYDLQINITTTKEQIHLLLMQIQNGLGRRILMAVSPRGAKEKGARFERELATYFATHLGLDVFRSLYTTDPMARKGKGSSDLVGVPDLAVEAKRVETLSFPAALAQAERNAGKREMPVVINRRSRMEIDDCYTVVRLGDFMKMYKAWCQKEGFCR